MGKDLKGKEIGEGLSQRKDGYYLARYQSPTGKRVQKTFKTKREAKAWRAEAIYQKEHCCVAAGERMTVDTCFQLWMENEKIGKVRDTTMKRIESNYRIHIRPVIGESIISDVRPLEVQSVINRMQTDGKSAGLCSIVRSVMRMIFGFAMENELIFKNPCRNVKLPTGNREERRVLLIEEQEKLLGACEDEDLKGIFRFALNTGMRSGEIRGLKWQDIDFKDRQIKVQRTVCDSKDGFIFHDPKTESGKRVVPMTQGAYDVLMFWKRKRKSGKVVHMEYSDLVFLKMGNPYKGSALDGRLQNLCEKAGIGKCSMHSLRHTYATRFIEAGGNPKMLQKILGHSNISMTMDLYVHATEQQKAAEVKKLEEYMKLVQNW